MTRHSPSTVLLTALATALLPALLAGCAHTSAAARPTPAIDGAAVARAVMLCKTTEAQLREKLGAPTRDGMLHNARIVSWITRWDSPVSYLAVLVDGSGFIVDLYWDIPTEIPWTPTNQCLGRNG